AFPARRLDARGHGWRARGVHASVVDRDGPRGGSVRARPGPAPREPRPRALAPGAADDRAGAWGAVRAGAGHAPLANAQARPSAAAIAGMSSGVLPQAPPIQAPPASP